MKRRVAAICLVLMLILCSCGAEETGMQDGSYTAEMSDYSFGWKEYVTITVKDGEIDALSGATESGDNFKKLAQAVVEQAMKGDSRIVMVSAEAKAE